MRSPWLRSLARKLSLLNPVQRTRYAKRRVCHPLVEQLEERVVLSHDVAATASVPHYPLPVMLAGASGDAPAVSLAPVAAQVVQPAYGLMRLPGLPGQLVQVQFRALGADAGFNNEFGLFITDDASGRIGNLRPGMAGYAAAALGANRHVPLYANRVPLMTSVPLPSGKFIGTYLVQNATSAAWRILNPANRLTGAPLAFFSIPHANPDQASHAALHGNVFFFEDMLGGGDRDFNDMVGQLIPGTPFFPRTDRVPPTLTVTSPANEAHSCTNITLTGQVTDAGSGPATLMAQIDNRTPFRVTLDASGNFSFTTNLPLNQSTLGRHVLKLRARDRAGNLTVQTRVFYLDESTFTPGLTGWTVNQTGGTASGQGTAVYEGGAVLHEGDSFRVSLAQGLTVGDPNAVVTFQYDRLQFDTSSTGQARDAFEVALVDANGFALTNTFLAGRDAFFNLTEGLTPAVGTFATVSHLTPTSGEVTLRLTDIPVGTAASLIFRLVNNDSDTGSQVRITCVDLPPGAVTSIPPFTQTATPPNLADLAGAGLALPFASSASGTQFDSGGAGPVSGTGGVVLGQPSNEEATAPPQLRVELPTPDGRWMADTPLVLTGLAEALRPELADGTRVQNSMTHVTVNDRPVAVHDSAGRFFERVDILPGVNQFTVTASDALGQEVSAEVTIIGTQSDTTLVDFSRLTDVSDSFTALYARTSFHERVRVLHAAIALRNDGSYPVNAPLYVGVRNMSDPQVRVLNAAGVTPDGIPYYDFTGLVTGGTLNPNGTTGQLDLAFFNPNGGQFSYDLVFFGLPNRAPVITTLPGVEAFPGRTFTYDVDATDPDGDPLQYRLTSAPEGMTISASGGISWTPTAGNLGNHPLTVRVEDGRGGVAEQSFTLSVLTPPPNRPPVFTSVPTVEAALGQEYRYIATAVDPDADPLLFTLTGTIPSGMSIHPDTGLLSWTPDVNHLGEHTITVEVHDGRGGIARQTYTLCVDSGGNLIPTIVSAPVTQLNIDMNAGGTYTYVVEAVDPNGDALTYTLLQAPLGAVIDPGSGLVSWVASEQDVATHQFTIRVDDGRGGSDLQAFTVTVQDCTPGAREFDPVVEWQKSTFTVRPESHQVMMTPAVIDVNADGTPDVVFSTFAGNNYNSDGLLRAVSGRDGTELWTVTNPAYEVAGRAGIAVGDIDRDGRPEIIAAHESDRLIAFNADGTFKWMSPFIHGNVQWGSAALADLDHDGTAEIIIGSTVLNADGTPRWFGLGGRGDNVGGPLSLVADLDMDGSPEVVAGRTAYRSKGSTYWNAPVADGFPAIGNFDGDPFPEVVVVSSGNIQLLEHDGTVKWGPIGIPGGGLGGAPTIADFDNDGQAEIGVAGASRYVVFEADGTVKWTAVTQDLSSNVTGSSVFDFEGDGSAEVVYGDEVFLRIYNGADGSVRYQLPKSSLTTYEYPVIADVDGDGNAEIIAVANLGQQNGLYVIGDRNNTWVNARRIWNQHTYHITNVNDDGTIPTHEANSWEVYNTYRLNTLTTGFDPRAAADLMIVSASQTSATPLVYTARVMNQGNAPVNPGVSVAFYDGDPARGGSQVGSAVTTRRLRTGEEEVITVALNRSLVNDLWAVVDPTNAVAECDELNNALRLGVDLDPVNYAPVFQSTAVLTVTAGSRYRYDAIALDPDGDPLTFDLPQHPEGLVVHPTLGVLVWTPNLTQVGTHDVILRARDDAGNVTLQAFQVAVTPPNTAPVFTSTPPAGILGAGLPFVYLPTVIDADQDPVTLLLESGPAGMQLLVEEERPPRLVWTPMVAQVGLHTAVLQANDGRSGVTRQTLSFTVGTSPANAVPIIHSTPRLATWLSHPYTYAVEATDPNGDPLIYELVTAPAGMTVDAEGLITWQPAAAQVGSHAVAVRVRDGRGGVATQQFTLAVTTTPANSSPFITTPPRQSATVGRAYVVAYAAVDPDNDGLVWSLDQAPHGMAIDSRSGLLTWIPSADQMGTQAVTVRVTDALGAFATQHFSITVHCVNQAPTVTSRPGTRAYAGEAYLYAVRADDPDGDQLTFTLLAPPTGMNIDSRTGVVRWTPQATQAGLHGITVQVDDGNGNVAQQVFTLEVSAQPSNNPPVFTSQPRLVTTAGQLYAYDVTASDPEGQAVTFSFLPGTPPPAGMTLTSNGQLRWTPGTQGSFVIALVAVDPSGAQAVQSFVLEVMNNLPPQITSNANTQATANAPYRYDVRATDPNGDDLTYALTSAPSGMAIDQLGRITWQPGLAQIGSHAVTVTVTDEQGLSASQAYTVQVSADTQAPRVTLLPSETRLALNGTLQLQVAATDNVGVTGLGLAMNGMAIPLSATGQATLRMEQTGTFIFTATARDAAGNTGTATVTVQVVDPADTTGPDVFILSPAKSDPNVGETNEATVTYLSPIVGTVDDPGDTLSHWQVRIGRLDQVDIDFLDTSDPDYRLVGQGTTEVQNGTLATFDPTLLLNDQYVLLVSATDASGNTTTKGIFLSVTGNAKLGEFRLEFTDYTLPLAGIPIQISRIYDTRQSTESRDFGYGWSLGVQDARIRETVPPGPGGGLFSDARPFMDGTKVYLTAPDGQRVGFSFRPELAGGSYFFGATYRPRFVADPGVYWSLEVDDAAIRPTTAGYQTIAFPIDYNPDSYRLVSPEGLTYHYHQHRGLERITDRNGNTVTYSSGGIQHSSGIKIDFVRDGLGRVTALKDPNGKVSVRYHYDVRGDLVRVEQVASRTPQEEVLTSQFTYHTDRPHYLDEYTDPNGHRAVKTEYGPDGRILAVTDALGNRAEQDYDLANFTETVRDQRGNATLITYNGRGNVTRTEQATEFGPVVRQFFYDDPANPDKETKLIDPRGIVTTRAYDARGNLLAETTPDGTTAYTYSLQNKLTSVMDPLSRYTAYSYDAAGNLLKVVNPLGDASEFLYDSKGRVQRFSDFAGNDTFFEDYCGCGRPATVRNPDGSVRRIEYNVLGQVTKVTDEVGNVTVNDYDDLGRLVRVIDGTGKATLYDYELANLIKVTDPLGNFTTYKYDKAGNKTHVIDAEGGVVSFGYDANSNLITVTDPVQNTTTFMYDKANRLMEEVDPLGKSRHFAYDPAGNRIEVIDRNGRRRTFEFDGMNRVTLERWWEGVSPIRDITSDYDNVGNLLETNDPAARLTYTYDALNRVRTATTEYHGTNVPVVTLTYGYDANGNRISVADNFGVRVDSQYGSRNELEWRTWQGGGIDPVRVEFDYYANGDRQRLERFANLAGTVQVGSTDYTYYANGLSQTIRHRGGSGNLLVGYDYQYDAAGRLVQETHHGKTYTYGYDKTSQLLSARINGLFSESFAYDKNGNRLTSTGPNGNQTYQTGPGNQLLNDGKFRYEYDAEGNLTKKTEIATGNMTEYSWDHRNRLVEVEERSAGGIVLTTSIYGYDSLGRRIVQAINGVARHTVYDQDHAWSDHDSSGLVSARFLFGGRIDEVLARWQPGVGTSWYLADQLGTVREILAPGQVYHAQYTVFGSRTADEGFDRFGFTGRELDRATGEWFYRARYYASTTGRFLQPDPSGFAAGDANLTRYGFNSPLNGTDPSGRSFVEYAKILVQPGLPEAPSQGQVEGAVIGGVLGFALPSIYFVAEFLGDGDIGAAYERTEAHIKLLLARLGAVSDVAGKLDGPPVVGGFLTGFKSGIEYDMASFYPNLGEVFSLLAPLGVVNVPGISIGGFANGSELGLLYLRSVLGIPGP